MPERAYDLIVKSDAKSNMLQSSHCFGESSELAGLFVGLALLSLFRY